MKSLQVSLGPAAIRDIVEQAAWYEAQAGELLSDRWRHAVESTLLRAADRPAIGAPCELLATKLRSTRRIAIQGFPRHLLFYQAVNGKLLVLRVLHGARDLDALLEEGVG